MKNSLKNNKCSKEEAYIILKEFLNEEINLSLRKEITEETFLKPNWELYQAYQAGMRKAFHKVKDFLPDQGQNK